MKNQEQHDLFPSGEWEGFYLYGLGPKKVKHLMSFSLSFHNGEVTGSGSDDVGAFIWRGTYDTKELWCQMTKFYRTHPVDYHGAVDSNGIWGQWRIYTSRGGFHIWPKKQKNGINEEESEMIERALEREMQEFQQHEVAHEAVK